MSSHLSTTDMNYRTDTATKVHPQEGMEKMAKRWFINYLEQNPSDLAMYNLRKLVKNTPFENELKEYFTDSKHAKNFKFMEARDAGRELAELVGDLSSAGPTHDLTSHPLFRNLLERYTTNTPTAVFKHGEGRNAYRTGKGNAAMTVGQHGQKFNKKELTSLLSTPEPDAYEFVRTAANEMPKFKDAFIPDTPDNRKLLGLNKLTGWLKSKKLSSLQDTNRNTVYRGGMGGYHHADSLPALQDIADPWVTSALHDSKPVFFSPSARVGAQYALGAPSAPVKSVQLNSRWLRVPDPMLENLYNSTKKQLNADAVQQNITNLRNKIQKNMPRSYIMGFGENVQTW